MNSAKTASLIYTASGTGLQGFSIPFDCLVRAMYTTATQTGGACVSLNSATTASSGLQGVDRAILGILGGSTLLISDLSHHVNAKQQIFIDVKVAGSFVFVCELLDEE